MVTRVDWTLGGKHKDTSYYEYNDEASRSEQLKQFNNDKLACQAAAPYQWGCYAMTYKSFCDAAYETNSIEQWSL